MPVAAEVLPVVSPRAAKPEDDARQKRCKRECADDHKEQGWNGTGRRCGPRICRGQRRHGGGRRRRIHACAGIGRFGRGGCDRSAPARSSQRDATVEARYPGLTHLNLERLFAGGRWRALRGNAVRLPDIRRTSFGARIRDCRLERRFRLRRDLGDGRILRRGRLVAFGADVPAIAFGGMIDAIVPVVALGRRALRTRQTIVGGVRRAVHRTDERDARQRADQNCRSRIPHSICHVHPHR